MVSLFSLCNLCIWIFNTFCGYSSSSIVLFSLGFFQVKTSEVIEAEVLEVNS